MLWRMPVDDAGEGRRPRLLVLTSTFPAHPGDGTPAFVADLARTHAAHFHTVVLTPAVPGGPTHEARDGFEVRRYRYYPHRWEDLAAGAIIENVRARPSRLLQVPFLLAGGMLALRRAVREFRPDVIHVHWIVPQGLMALVSARNLPWLVTAHGGDLYALDSRPLRRLKRDVVRRARAVTVMNDEMRKRVVDLGVSPELASVLPMGVDLRLHGGEHSVRPVPGRLVFVGRLVEKKGVGVLLQALGRIPDDVEWSLEVVGDGPLRAQLEEEAAPLGDRVTFTGQVPGAAVHEALRRAQIAVLPSVRAHSGDQDGRPVALLEALAAGVPVVASDLPGLAEVVDGVGAAGVLVPAGDAGAFAAAITRLLSDPDGRRRMGRVAAQRAASHSVEAVGARYLELLRGMSG
jgi:colanic acid/amylovoran biosynthesis glycosyltransferase